MVSEGDLVGRDETERDARREWWLALLAEGESLSADFLSSCVAPNASRATIMSKPVVTVSEDTDTGEIARLLLAYRIKRVPVVRNGQVVGIVSRENLLRLLAKEESHHDVSPQRALSRALWKTRWRRSSGVSNVRATRPNRMRRRPAQPDDTSSAAADFRRLAAGLQEQGSAAPRGAAP